MIELLKIIKLRSDTYSTGPLIVYMRDHERIPVQAGLMVQKAGLTGKKVNIMVRRSEHLTMVYDRYDNEKMLRNLGRDLGKRKGKRS